MNNYFFSGWMGNLGVEPLLRFSFLRFKPLRFTLLARLISVTFVLDAIFMLLIFIRKGNTFFNKITNIIHFNLEYLQIFIFSVKRIVPSSIFFIFSYGTLALQLAYHCHAKEEDIGKSELKPKTAVMSSKDRSMGSGQRKERRWSTRTDLSAISAQEDGHNNGRSKIINTNSNVVLAIGEHYEIKLSNLQHYSIGNSEVIGHRYLSKRQVLLIKGKRQGHCEIAIWLRGGERRIQQIYVLAQKEEMNWGYVQELLGGIAGVTIKEAGPILQISGELERLSDYFLLLKIYKKYSQQVYLQIKLAPMLRNEVLADIYSILLPENINKLSCWVEGIEVYCRHDQSTLPGPTSSAFLKERHLLTLIPFATGLQQQNYLLRLKLVQLESGDSHDFSLGPSHLSSSLRELIEQGPKGVVLNSEVNLEDRKIKVKTLAGPEVILRPGHPVLLEMGASIPFESTGREYDHLVEWHFAGLKVNLEVNSKGEELELQYKSEFTEPNKQYVVGSKESSRLTIRLQELVELFQIGISTIGSKERSMPWLGKIPILGAIFSAESEQNSYKRIYGMAIIEKYFGP